MPESKKDGMVNEGMVMFSYKNWRGETSVRAVYPIQLWYGKTEWHPEQQWFLKAFDAEKVAMRDFAMKDITNWQPY